MRSSYVESLPSSSMTTPQEDHSHDTAGDRFGRRESLVKAGGLAIAVLGAGALPASAAATARETSAASCVLAPEMTQGPFYVPNEKVRRNIREGQPGVALALRLGVVDASSCRPITGAAVDIWHADAAGEYSGIGSNGTSGRTFLRGVQRTDAKGIARFDTVYPGWYQGRTVHIHVMVHVSGDVVHTGQLFFDDALTDAVFTRKPYSTRSARDVRNADDGIYGNGGSRSLLRMRRQGTGYLGTISMGVRRG
jgi:protocatechuate 3,4-dioxygenase beta subunit